MEESEINRISENAKEWRTHILKMQVEQSKEIKDVRKEMGSLKVKVNMAGAEYAKLLGTALSIWEHKLKHKYLEQYNETMEKIRNEESKIESDPENANHSLLDSYYFKLRLIGNSFTSDAGKNLVAKPN